MRILLIAPDSKYPNLAMMKISAYYKARGDEVGFHVSDPDHIFGSILFRKNRGWVGQWKMMYPGLGLTIGGPGYDVEARLPPEIEKMPPDQNLYESKYSIGRVTSGCIRECPFCVVPQMEPKGIRYIQGPEQIWKPGKILRLLDDNILAMPKAFAEVCSFCKKHDVTIHFEYLDCRLIAPSVAKALKEMKHDGQIKFSFDMTRDEPHILEGIREMIIAGFRPSALQFLIYLHDEKSIPDAMHRWDVIRAQGCEPFLMVNNEARTGRLRRVARRGCRPAIWRGLTTKEVFE